MKVLLRFEKFFFAIYCVNTLYNTKLHYPSKFKRRFLAFTNVILEYKTATNSVNFAWE